MPYTIKGTSVVKKTTGKVVKTHPTKAKALKHLAALEAAHAMEKAVKK